MLSTTNCNSVWDVRFVERPLVLNSGNTLWLYLAGAVVFSWLQLQITTLAAAGQDAYAEDHSCKRAQAAKHGIPGRDKPSWKIAASHGVAVQLPVAIMCNTC